MKNLGKELGDIALVFSGGVGLGSYQAGAYAHLQAHGITPLWIAGSSVGGVNAALIAGTPLQTRLSALQSFWISDGPSVFCTPFPSRAWKHAQNWMKVVETRLFGARGHFRPHFLNQAFQPFSSVYDLTPMRERIEKLVDFDRLNGGDIRCTV